MGCSLLVLDLIEASHILCVSEGWVYGDLDAWAMLLALGVHVVEWFLLTDTTASVPVSVVLEVDHGFIHGEKIHLLQGLHVLCN